MYGALHPYIIRVYAQQFCCAVTPTFGSKQRRGDRGNRAHSFACGGASLDKAEDNKECILNRSDESHLRWKLTSKWAGCDPHLHVYLFFHKYVYSFI